MNVFTLGRVAVKPQSRILERSTALRSHSGDIVLRRALPTRDRGMIGAWCFLEQAGPDEIGDGGGLRAGPQPYLGLQALTWMIEGELLYRDSLGNKQVFRGGELNVVTAGSGMTHSRESPSEQPGRIDAVQLWIALPETMRRCEPSFTNYPALPKMASGGFGLTLLIGELFAEKSPVPAHTPLVAIELVTNGAASTTLPLRCDFEYGVLVLEGTAVVAGEYLRPGELLYLGEHHTRLGVRCEGAASLLLIGGKPLEDIPVLWWSFIGHNQDEMVEYAHQWNATDHFGTVHGFDGPRAPAPMLPVENY